jgi:hypothetical protein
MYIVPAILVWHLATFANGHPQERRKEFNCASWRTVSDTSRSFYAAGLVRGASELSWMIVLSTEPGIADDDAARTIVRVAKPWENVDIEQVRDGLNTFCEDYRNRQIGVVSAANVVFMELKGKPREDIDAMIQRLRNPPTR